MVDIVLSTGFKPTLSLTIRKYIPKDISLLDHIVWRLGEHRPTERVPSPPWALSDDGLKGEQINKFLDDMIPELLQEPSFRKKDTLWTTTFEYTYARSKQDSETVSPVSFTTPLDS
jgi:hypothetical protein